MTTFDWPEYDEHGNPFINVYQTNDPDLLSAVGSYWYAVKDYLFTDAGYGNMEHFVGDTLTGEIIDLDGTRMMMTLIPVTDPDELFIFYEEGLLDEPDGPVRGYE